MGNPMIRRVMCVLVILLTSASVHAQTPLLRDNDRVAIAGDSITEQKQYSVFMETYFLACRPVADLRAIQFGWSGERTPAFAGRVENDVLRFSPTVVTTCYGMNDGGYTVYTDAIGEAYRKSTQEAVRKLKAAGVRVIIVGSPGCVDSVTYRRQPHGPDVYNQTLAKLRDIARAVAEEEGVAFADVHQTMYDVMAPAKEKYGDTYHVAGADGVHPDANGHLAMAYAFLKTLLGKEQQAIARIEHDFSAGTATANDGHTVVSASNAAIELESTRYPFCFYGELEKTNSTLGLLPFLPFNDDLNRFTLIVKNAPARAKVTWGELSKEFDKAALEQGINLAAEFAGKTPFQTDFQKLLRAVQAKQAYETQMIKQYITTTPALKKLVPEETESIDRIAAAMQRTHDQRAADVAKLVTPVRHTIRIEEVK